MAEKIIRACDECKTEAINGEQDGWLKLENFGNTRHQVYLQADHHFCSLDCLAGWSRRAANHAVKMVATANNIQPRGTFVNDELGLCY